MKKPRRYAGRALKKKLSNKDRFYEFINCGRYGVLISKHEYKFILP